MNRGGEVTNLGEKLVLAAAFGCVESHEGDNKQGGTFTKSQP